MIWSIVSFRQKKCLIWCSIINNPNIFTLIISSIVLLGVKEWIFLSPGEERKLELSSGNYVYDVESKQSKDLQVLTLVLLGV